MLAATLWFSLMNLCVKMMPGMPIPVVLLFRAGITLGFSLWQIRQLGLHPWGYNKPVLWLRGIFGTGGLALYFITLQQIPLAGAVTLQYLSPIFTLIFTRLLLGERFKWIQTLFFLVSFAGVYVVGNTDERIVWVWLLTGIGSAVFSGLAYTMIRKASVSEHPVVVVFYFPLIALPLVGLWSYFDWKTPEGIEWFWLLGTGLSTQFAQLAMTKAFMQEKAANVLGLQYLGLIYALFLGWWIFDEQFDWITIGGMALVLLGVLGNIAIQYTAARKKQKMGNSA
jgi:drug/metabolite transporter (DMT)-like permease